MIKDLNIKDYPKIMNNDLYIKDFKEYEEDIKETNIETNIENIIKNTFIMIYFFNYKIHIIIEIKTYNKNNEYNGYNTYNFCYYFNDYRFLNYEKHINKYEKIGICFQSTYEDYKEFIKDFNKYFIEKKINNFLFFSNNIFDININYY